MRKCKHPNCSTGIKASNQSGMCRPHLHVVEFCQCDKCAELRERDAQAAPPPKQPGLKAWPTSLGAQPW